MHNQDIVTKAIKKTIQHCGYVFGKKSFIQPSYLNHPSDFFDNKDCKAWLHANGIWYREHADEFRVHENTFEIMQRDVNFVQLCLANKIKVLS